MATHWTQVNSNFKHMVYPTTLFSQSLQISCFSHVMRWFNDYLAKFTMKFRRRGNLSGFFSLNVHANLKPSVCEFAPLPTGVDVLSQGCKHVFHQSGSHNIQWAAHNSDPPKKMLLLVARFYKVMLLDCVGWSAPDCGGLPGARDPKSGRRR